MKSTLTRKKYIVFFDIDETVIRINSSTVIIKAAYKIGLISTLKLLNAIYLVILYKLKLKDPKKIIEQIGTWITGINVDEFNKMMSDILDQFIIKEIRPEIIAEIKHHKEQDAELVILSSAIKEVCNPLATHLGIDHVLCSELETQKGQFTGKTIGNFCFGKEKLVQLNKYCSLKGYNIEETFYYGDSIADLPVLEKVGFPICVTPDKALLKIASVKGWTIKQWC